MPFPKRITFVTSSMGSGGAERVLSIVANELARRGSAVSIIATSTHKTKPFYTLVTGVSFTTPFAGRAYRHKIAAVLAFARIQKDLRSKVLETVPDVIVSFVDKTNTLTCAALGKCGIPIVACEHIYPPQQPLGFFWKAARRLFYLRAAVLTVLTEEAIDFFPLSMRSKTVVLPNPVLPPPSGISEASAVKTKRIVSAGRFTDQKGFDRLIRAFANSSSSRPGWTLRILGDGPKRAELEALRDSLGLGEKVELPGVTAEIYKEYTQAAFYVLSSRFEGFPMTLCEALSSGLPAVAMDCMTGPRHILRDGVDGLLVPDVDEMALAAAMGRLMDDEALRARLAARAPDVVDRFSLDRVMRLWEEIFRRASRDTTPAPVALLVNWLGTGGAERVVLTIATELLRRGHKVDLVCIERNVIHDIPDGLSVHFLSNSSGKEQGGIKKLLALPALALSLARLSRKRGWVVVQSHLFRANYVNVLSKSFGARHSVQIVNHSKVDRFKSEGLSGRVNSALTRHLYLQADRIIVIARRMASDLASFLGIPESRIETIYNPYDVGLIQDLARQSGGSPILAGKGRRYIIAMGRLVPLKRFGELIEAFSRVAVSNPDLDLVILGEGPERSNLKETARACGCAERVFFPGHLTNPYPAIAAAFAFALVSETEGFPNSLIEALALKVPILSTDCVSGPREILAPTTDWNRTLRPGEGIEIAEFGLLAPVGDPTALTEGLRLLLSDETVTRRYAMLGPSRAAAFDAKTIVDRYAMMLYPEKP